VSALCPDNFHGNVAVPNAEIFRLRNSVWARLKPNLSVA
jgi:hypothetical protein